MAGSRDERKLTLLDDFNAAGTSVDESASEQIGYQKVDDLTVLERKLFPILTSTTSRDQAIVRVDVYDFNSYTVTTLNMTEGNENAHLPAVFRNFSEVEGKQSIRDAHRALTELGGSPPPIDEIMGYIVELNKSVSISAPLKFKPGNP